jgi:hypothetical protein
MIERANGQDASVPTLQTITGTSGGWRKTSGELSPGDPAMFQALVSLLQDKDEPVRSTASGILAPVYEPNGGEGAQRRCTPEGGWEKWLNEIQAALPAEPPSGDFPDDPEVRRAGRCESAGRADRGLAPCDSEYPACAAPQRGCVGQGPAIIALSTGGGRSSGIWRVVPPGPRAKTSDSSATGRREEQTRRATIPLRGLGGRFFRMVAMGRWVLLCPSELPT